MLTDLTVRIGERSVQLDTEIEEFSERIAKVCVQKLKQQSGEPVDVEDWVVRLRSPEDVIERMFKKEKIKTLMEADREVIEEFLSQVRRATMKKYMSMVWDK